MHRASPNLIERLEQRLLLSVDVTIDADTRYQTIDGFGSALSFWINSPYNTAAWRSMYYQDLGSSMLRVDMRTTALVGSDGDWRTPTTLGTDLASNIAQFNFGAYGVPVFGTTAQAGQTLKLDQLKVVAALWSPPQWMKGEELNWSTGAGTGVFPVLNGSDSSGGSLIDTPENLAQFGRYVATWVAGFEQYYGVKIYSVSLQNELTLHTSYSSCVYTPALFAKAVKAAGDAFAMWGIDTKIQGPEYFGIGGASEPWQINNQRRFIDAIKADPSAYAALDSYVTHDYPTSGAPDGRSPEMWDQFWNGRTVYPTWPALKLDGRKLWMTESSEEGTDWTGAMLLASKTQEALSFGNVSAWIYWQTSGDNTSPSVYALTVGSDTTANKYVAEKHFFRYIRPDAVRIAATPNDPNGVEVSAYVQDEQHTLTTVLVNRSTSSQTVNLNLGSVGLSSFGVYFQSTSSAKWVNMGPLAISGGVATLTLPASSIVTLQGNLTRSTRVPVAADSYVKGGVSAPRNFGADTVLMVKDDAIADYDRSAYLRFDLSQFPPRVSSATLNLPVASVGTDVAAMTLQVLLVADDNWSETGITWSNRPAGSTVLGTIASVSFSPGAAIHLDLTSAVRDAINTDKKLSLVLLASSAPGSNRWVQFGSRESTTLSLRPDLTVMTDEIAPTVVSAAINDGAIQRSMVKSATVVFSEAVTLGSRALDVLKTSGAAIPGADMTLATPDGGTTWRLTFSNTGAVGNSLPDGLYNLFVSAAGVQDLVGNPLAANFVKRFHRLFGDSDGDRDVDNSDLLRFRQAMKSTYDPTFDYTADGLINGSDYLQLKLRLTGSVLR